MAISERFWPNLKECKLADWRLGDIDCRYLTLSEWPQLEKLSLSNIVFIKHSAVSLKKAIFISPKQTGLNLKNSESKNPFGLELKHKNK